MLLDCVGLDPAVANNLPGEAPVVAAPKGEVLLAGIVDVSPPENNEVEPGVLKRLPLEDVPKRLLPEPKRPPDGC